jgi:hypothetical protein
LSVGHLQRLEVGRLGLHLERLSGTHLGRRRCGLAAGRDLTETGGFGRGTGLKNKTGLFVVGLCESVSESEGEGNEEAKQSEQWMRRRKPEPEPVREAERERERELPRPNMVSAPPPSGRESRGRCVNLLSPPVENLLGQVAHSGLALGRVGLRLPPEQRLPTDLRLDTTPHTHKNTDTDTDMDMTRSRTTKNPIAGRSTGKKHDYNLSPPSPFQ